jgi:hydrogenase nickel incorporation protein HypA/HybF
MHELTLCRNIIDITLRNIPPNTKVKKINLEIGKLVSVDPQALLFSFDVIAKNTQLSDALLNIIEIDGKASCNVCNYSFVILKLYVSCMKCGGHALSILAGEELRIKSMEVEPCVEFAAVVKVK